MANYMPGIFTRQKIVNAAKALFYENGVKKVTIKEICLAAGIRPSLFFHYFENKETLVSAIWKWLDTRVAIEVKKRWNASESDAYTLPMVFNIWFYISLRKDEKIARFAAEVYETVPSIMLSWITMDTNRYVMPIDAKNLDPKRLEIMKVATSAWYTTAYYRYKVENKLMSDNEYIQYFCEFPMREMGMSAEDAKNTVAKALDIAENGTAPLNLGELLRSNYSEFN